MLFRVVCLLTLLILATSVEAQPQDTVVIPAPYYQVATSNNNRLVLINQSLEHINTTYSGIKGGVLLGDLRLGIVNPVDSFAYRARYRAKDSFGKTYWLHFTTLPVMHIHTTQGITNEPRRPARLQLTTPDGESLTTWIGVEYKGAGSLSDAKKSYRIECWTDSLATDKVDHALLGMRNDDDWDLQALYREPLRLRTPVVAELWRDLSVLHYAEQQPDAKGYVDSRYVEVYVDGLYRGIYLLAERIDRKQLQLKKYDDEDAAIRGTMTKAVMPWVEDYTPAPYDNSQDYWNGHEHYFPDEAIDWGYLSEWYDFVDGSDDSTFQAQYADWFDIPNAVDYWILLNVFRMIDNTGKNLWYVRYDNDEPLFYVPMDFNATIGMKWDNTVLDITDDTIGNAFYTRLFQDCSPGGFQDLLQQRWAEVRPTLLQHGALMERVRTHHTLLTESGAYAREAARWDAQTFPFSADTAKLTYIDTFLQARLAYLDAFFLQLCEIETVTSPGDSTVQDTSGQVVALTPITGVEAIRAYPNPVRDVLHLQLPHDWSGAQYNLYDISGRMIMQDKIAASSGHIHTIDASGLGAGCYLLQLHHKGDRVTLRVLKK